MDLATSLINEEHRERTKRAREQKIHFQSVVVAIQFSPNENDFHLRASRICAHSF